MIPTILLPLALLVTASSAAITAKNAMTAYPYALQLGPTIEGASVDVCGDIFAVNKTHFISLQGGMSDSSKLSIITSGGEKSQLASSRFTRTLGVLVGDALAHTITQRRFGAGLTPIPPQGNRHGGNMTALFLDNPKFLQPNDMAISRDETKIYFSGMNYTATTIAGQMGDLWYYNVVSRSIKKVAPDVLAAAGVHRTNGIELSPDDKTLYLTSAQNVENNVTAAKIFRFDIDPSTGTPTKPTVAVDLYPVLAALGVPAKEMGIDPDGMRTDVDGNLYATLNAGGRVLKYSPQTKKSEVITLETVAFPSNIELGGKDGKTAVVVGRCKGGKTSCVDSFKVDKPGRAWSNLQRGSGTNAYHDE